MRKFVFSALRRVTASDQMEVWAEHPLHGDRKQASSAAAPLPIALRWPVSLALIVLHADGSCVCANPAFRAYEPACLVKAARMRLDEAPVTAG